MSAKGIYGLSGSGLDIESLVKVGMMSRQSQYDKMYRAEKKSEWQKEAYGTIYSTISTFNMSTLSNYKMESTMNAMTAKSSDESVVTVTANGAAAPMPHLVSVQKLATNAYMMSNGRITRANDSKPNSIELEDVLFKSVTKTTTDTDPNNEYDVVDPDGTTRHVKGTDVAFSFKVSDDLATGNPPAHASDHIFTISYTYDDLANTKKTLNDLASDISTAKADFSPSGQTRNVSQVRAGFDASGDSFSLYQRNAGDEAAISITASDDISARLFNNLHLNRFDAANNSLQPLHSGSGPDFTAGQDVSIVGAKGQATIDGKVFELTSNRLVAAGVAYNLQTTTPPGQTVTVTVAQDTSGIIDQVKKFVDDYNKLIDNLNTQYNQATSDYEPLTDAQRKAMTEDQANKWETRAKEGLLYHDSTLGKIINNMRDALFTPVEGAGVYNTAYSIGIQTPIGRNDGHIELDEDKLKKALAADPSSVYRLFASTDTQADAVYRQTGVPQTDNPSYLGIANRMSYYFNQNLKDLRSVGGTTGGTDDDSALGSLIRQQKEQMSNFKAQMSAYETALYKKYDAMEATLGSMNSMFQQMFGG